MMILFVCTGNTCRSPMAAALMRRRLDRAGAGDIIVDSAGLAAGGETVTPEAAAAMEEIGLHIAGRRSRPLTAALCREADIIAVMTTVTLFALEFKKIMKDLRSDPNPSESLSRS